MHAKAAQSALSPNQFFSMLFRTMHLHISEAVQHSHGSRSDPIWSHTACARIIIERRKAWKLQFFSIAHEYIRWIIVEQIDLNMCGRQPFRSLKWSKRLVKCVEYKMHSALILHYTVTLNLFHRNAKQHAKKQQNTQRKGRENNRNKVKRHCNSSLLVYEVD